MTERTCGKEMSALGSKLRQSSNGISFWCPGCDEAHRVITDGTRGWTFNGDGNKPTISPSVLVRSGHYEPGNTGSCWCEYNKKQVVEGKPESKFKCSVCHSFVIEGKIQFLGDCTHDLAGHTVDLPNWPIGDNDD